MGTLTHTLTFDVACVACGSPLHVADGISDGRSASVAASCANCAATYLVQVQLHALPAARVHRKSGLPPHDHRHGTQNGYGNYGCRCDQCKAAHHADRERYRDRSRKAAS